MNQFTTFTSKAVPILLPNIDTDIITPMNRYTTESEKPLSYYAFEPLRYLNNADQGELNPEFALNKPEYQGAKILLTGENFGCGSSRETAVTALVGLGIRSVIGSSFGEIFFNNCFQQGLLPVRLPKEMVVAFADESARGEFKVNLEEKTIISPSGIQIDFEVNEFRRNCLLEGLDDIGMTLKRDNEIAAYQVENQKHSPWIYQI